MATLEELKEELRQAQGDLRASSFVTWGNPNGGAIKYSNQLAKCHQLQKQIQEASK